MVFTKESLKELISSKLKDYKLIIVSNREPYIHDYVGEEIKYIIPASGMVTAIDPIIRAEVVRGLPMAVAMLTGK